LVLAARTWGFNDSAGLTVFLGLLVNLSYTIMVAFLIVSFGPLEWRRCLRNQNLQGAEEEELRKRGEDVERSKAMWMFRCGRAKDSGSEGYLERRIFRAKDG